MKDELGEEIMREFIAPRPKMYKVNSKESKKCKEVKKCVVRENIDLPQVYFQTTPNE